MMKAIISHDIDHITASEHYFKDLVVPKHLIRSKIEFFTGKISINEVGNRYLEFFRNRWHNMDELQKFNTELGVPNSFFIGVKNGIGLSYSTTIANEVIKKLLANKSNVYVHGINYQKSEDIISEKNIFEKTYSIPAKGIRMHYVRHDNTTLQKIASAGYLFDSTMCEFKNPYKVGQMWEFPFQIMDGWIIENGKRRQSRNLKESIEATKIIIEKAQKINLTHLGIDFHDRYFSNSFKTWMNWYSWLTEYLKQNNIQFIDFESAIKEVEIQNLETVN